MGSTLSTNVVYGIDLNWPSDAIELEESSISSDIEFYAEFLEELDEYENPDVWAMETKIKNFFPSLAIVSNYYSDFSYGSFLHVNSRAISAWDTEPVFLDLESMSSTEGRDDLLAAAEILGVKDAEPGWIVLVSYG